MPETIVPLLPHVPAFLLVLFRVGAIFMFAPVLGSDVVPMRAKALLALVLAFCVYPLVPAQVPIELSVWSMAPAVFAELTIGLVIGYAASLPLIGMEMGGVMIGQQIGTGMAQVFNPEFQSQTTVLGQMLFLFALVIFLILDGHHAMLSTLVHSFGHVPLGGYMPDGRLLGVVTGLLGAAFELSVRVAAPLLCLVFLETVAMGFVSRTMPQLNILSLSFPMRILIGLGVVGALAALMVRPFTQALHEVFMLLDRLFAPAVGV